MTNVTEPSCVYGADVSKKQIMVGRYGETVRQSLPNTTAALSRWVATLPPGALLVMEATNTYHELLATVAFAAGVQVVVLNPRRAWHYARAIGQRGKTDQVDTSMLARFGSHEWRKLPRWQPPTPGNSRLAKLLARRTKLMSVNVALRQSLSSVKDLQTLRRQTEHALAAIIERLDLLILKTVAQDAQMSALHRLLQTIVGVGPVVGAQLVQALTRFTWNKEDAFIAYTGLDPRPEDSGMRHGRRKLTKHGSPMLRHMLYMAAMAASKTRLWKPIYKALRARGLKTTEALVVIARRIGRIAFAIFKTGHSFEPERLPSNRCSA